MKNGLATHPYENNILAYTEEIWEKIDKSDVCCNKIYSKSKIKNTLRGLAFNMINLSMLVYWKIPRKLKSYYNFAKILQS